MMSEQISSFLKERINAGDFPSAVYLVAEKGEIVFLDALGFAVVEPERIEAHVDSIYDLASLTKVLVVGLLTAILVENAKMILDESVSKHLRSIVPNEKGDISILDLLRHTSGFQGWVPFYLLVMSRSDVLGEIMQTPLVDEQWELLEELDAVMTTPLPEKPAPVLYSDLNFLTLMFIIERLMDKRIDEVASQLIFESLGLENTFFNPPVNRQHRIAASEFGNYYEWQTCSKLGY